MQRLLIAPPPYAPLPTETDRYVPVLQSRTGELTALTHARDADWQRMTPLIEVVKYREVVSADSLRASAKRLNAAVGGHPIYLDVKAIDPEGMVKTSKGERRALEVLYEAARARGLSFMPIARSTGSAGELEIVAATAEVDGHGLAIRHRVNGPALRDGVTLPLLFADCLKALAVDPEAVDLIFDMEYLSPDSDVAVTWLAAKINEIVQAYPWRSVVFVSTCIPGSFGGGLVEQDSVKALPRREWALWAEMSPLVARPLAYGDYAVQNPIPPLSPPPVGPWANVRYTTNDSFLISRGRDVRKTEDTQYVDVCRRLRESSLYREPGFSYGDKEIDRWANGSRASHLPSDETEWEEETSSQPYWRGVGTSHHLAQIAVQLAEHRQTAG